jgi:cell division protein FtsW (lipid II flippase)
MVKNLPPLDGTDVNWSLYQSQFVKSTIVWVIIAIVCLILFIVLKYDRIKKAVSYISVFLLLILVSTITVLSINSLTELKKRICKIYKSRSV